MADLVDRSKGLGASDAAASIGLSKWKSPLQLYREKRGEAQEDNEDESHDDEARLPLEIGSLVEPLVVAKLERRKKVTVIDRQRIFIDPTWPVRWATVDGITSDGLLVEAKTAGFIGQQWGENDTDEIPLQYHYQIQHGLVCTGLPAAWVPVIIGNTKVRIYRVERDSEMIEILTQGEKRFWWHVENGVPPAPSTMNDLRILYPHDIGTRVVVTNEIKLALDKFEANKAIAKRLDEAQLVLKLMIGEAFGSAAEMMDAAGNLIATYKTQDGHSYVDEDAIDRDFPGLLSRYKKRHQPFRVLRPKKPSKAKAKGKKA